MYYETDEFGTIETYRSWNIKENDLGIYIYKDTGGVDPSDPRYFPTGDYLVKSGDRFIAIHSMSEQTELGNYYYGDLSEARECINFYYDWAD